MIPAPAPLTRFLRALLRETRLANLRPTAPEENAWDPNANPCATLGAGEGSAHRDPIHCDLPCAEPNRHESSEPEPASAPSPSRMASSEQFVPSTAEEALHLAIKLALDAGEYERAAALLEVARRKGPALARVAPPPPARKGRRA